MLVWYEFETVWRYAFYVAASLLLLVVTGSFLGHSFIRLEDDLKLPKGIVGNVICKFQFVCVCVGCVCVCVCVCVFFVFFVFFWFFNVILRRQ